MERIVPRGHVRAGSANVAVIETGVVEMAHRNRRSMRIAVAAVMLSTELFVGIGASSAQQSVPPPPEISLAVRAEKARSLANIYAEKMRISVIQALKEGGTVGAIGACHTLAPELNVTTSDESAFEIARTALRVRNADNAPDAWELAGLENFQKALTAGGDPKTMETYDVVSTKEGQKLFRYMRPIMMREPCMACHGPSVAQDVKAEIAKYYSDDKAIGYNLGDLRGAFSMVQQLD